jgi:hypothetical protein
MGRDILNLFFTGNLTENATQRDFNNKPEDEKKKDRVINFTVASNLDENTKVFIKCSYWTSSKGKEKNESDTTEQPVSMLDLLTKGKKVTVTSKRFKVTNSSHTNSEGVTTHYGNLEITVDTIVIGK